MADDLTKVLIVVVAQDHPHYGCTGYLTGKIVDILGEPMAEVKSDKCKHMTNGFFVRRGELKRV